MQLITDDDLILAAFWQREEIDSQSFGRRLAKWIDGQLREWPEASLRGALGTGRPESRIPDPR